MVSFLPHSLIKMTWGCAMHPISEKCLPPVCWTLGHVLVDGQGGGAGGRMGRWSW